VPASRACGRASCSPPGTTATRQHQQPRRRARAGPASLRAGGRARAGAPAPAGLTTVRGGPVGLLRDLQDLYQLDNLVDSTWMLVGQAAHGVEPAISGDSADTAPFRRQGCAGRY
jgi:hypothetical protein